MSNFRQVEELLHMILDWIEEHELDHGWGIGDEGQSDELIERLEEEIMQAIAAEPELPGDPSEPIGK